MRWCSVTLVAFATLSFANPLLAATTRVNGAQATALYLICTSKDARSFDSPTFAIQIRPKERYVKVVQGSMTGEFQDGKVETSEDWNSVHTMTFRETVTIDENRIDFGWTLQIIETKALKNLLNEQANNMFDGEELKRRIRLLASEDYQRFFIDRRSGRLRFVEDTRASFHIMSSFVVRPRFKGSATPRVSSVTDLDLETYECQRAAEYKEKKF